MKRVSAVEHPPLLPTSARAEELARWHAIVDDLNHFVWTRDAAGRMDWVNRRFYDYVGLPPGKLQESFDAFVHAEDLKRIAPIIDTGLRSRQAFEHEYRIKRIGAPDSCYRWMLARSIPNFDRRGQLVGWIGTATDIHDQKTAAQRREQRLELLAEAIPQIVWQTTPAGRLDYCNSRWSAYTGLSIEATLNGGWLGVVHPDDVNPTLAAWQRALANETPYEVEYRIRGIDGVHRWFLVRATPIRDPGGVISCWLGTSTDIDERRRAAQVQRFSSEAIAELSRSSDVVQTCRLVADLAVQLVADYCILRLIDFNVRRCRNRCPSFPASRSTLCTNLRAARSRSAAIGTMRSRWATAA